MKKYLLVVTLLCLTSVVSAQALKKSDTTKTATTAAPVLSDTSKIALQAVQKEFAQAQADMSTAQSHLQSIQKDIVKEYPGYHLNLSTLAIEQDAPEKPESPTVKK